MSDIIEFKTSEKREGIVLHIDNSKYKFNFYMNVLNKDRHGLADSLNKMIESGKQTNPKGLDAFLDNYIKILKKSESGYYPVFEFINDCVANTKENFLHKYVEHMFFPFTCLKDSNYTLTKAGLMIKMHMPLFSNYISSKITGEVEDMTDVLYCIITTYLENFYPDSLSIIDIICNDIDEMIKKLVNISDETTKKVLTYTITRTLYRMEKQKDNLHALRMYVYSLYKIEYNTNDVCGKKLHDAILPIIEQREEYKNGVQ